MPFVPSEPSAPVTLPQAPQSPPLADVFGAAFRQGNTVVSALSALRSGGSFEPQEGYSAWDEIKDRPDYLANAAEFGGSHSPAETAALMARIDREEADKRTLAAAGPMGLVAGAVAGAVDPTMLLPGRVAIGVVREGVGVVRGAAEVGAAMGVQATAQEIGLQATQQTRPLEESVLNVGSATLLGALMGGAVSALSPAEHAGLVKGLDQERAELDAHVAGQPMPQPVGAAATDTRVLKPVAAAGLEKVGFDPTLQVLNQPSVAARRGYADVTELSILTTDNLQGGTSTSGAPPLETIYRTQNNAMQVRLRDMLLEQWTDWRFGSEKAPLAERLKVAVGANKSFEDFKTMVSDAMRQDDAHEIPQVQSVARFVRSHFEHWSDRAESSIPEFEKLIAKAGEGYFPHVWNKTKIAAERVFFTNKLTEKYAADQETKRQAQGRIQGLNEKLKDAAKRIEKAERSGNAEEQAAATLEHDGLRARIEEEIGKWEGKSAAEAKAAIKAREKYAAEAGRAAEAPRLRQADRAVDAAVERILGKPRDKSIEELRSIANETVDRILSSPDGRLPYDERAGAPRFGPQPSGEPMRGSLAGRLLDVSNAFARDWIENDIEQVVKTFNHTFMPDVLLAERFGDIEMSNVFRQVNEEYAAMVDATGPGAAARRKLEAQRQKTIENLTMVRDRLRGVYNIPVTASQRRLGRISAAVRNAMVPLNMGVSALSSIPDAAGTVFQWGMASTFRDGWVPFVKSLMTNRQYSREAMRQARVAGIAIDTATAQRHHEFAGIVDTARPGSPVERALQFGADKMQLANLLGPWTDLVKTISMTVNATNLYRAAKAATKGTATKKQIMELGAANIPASLYGKIIDQYEKSGTRVDGVLLPNTETWPRETREIFEAALSRNANINVVTPGIDRPGVFSDPVLSVLLQFKSFTAAATTRILIANLQRADAQTLQGLVASLALGMVSYKLNAMTGGQETSDRPQDWIKEAMSRGNIFGWLEEGNALAAKATGGKADIYRLIGADKPLSRFASQTAVDQLIGPTFGKMKDLTHVTGAIATGNWDAGDVKATRRMIAGQNLFWLRNAFNAVERGADNAFGIEVKH